eukprot:Hpha_TRINITY_DN15570_c4_g2::TRINITY_DN15570_c4_g2_i1::g.107291::m.107291
MGCCYSKGDKDRGRSELRKYFYSRAHPHDSDCIDGATLHNTLCEVRRDAGGEITQINNYKVKRCLGRGAFGQVWLCEDLCVEFEEEAENYAVKELARTQAGKDVAKEIDILARMSHPNVVRLLEYIDDSVYPQLFLVFESLGGGPLCECSTDGKLRGPGWTEARARKHMKQIVDGLQYLHSLGVIHRDIKPENIVFDDEQEVVKLIDFGESVQLQTVDGDDSGRETAGTPLFYAPEAMTGSSFSGKAADVWAVGVTLYLLLLGKVPFGCGASTQHSLWEAIQKNPLTFPAGHGLSTSAIELLERLLEKDPSMRITLTEVRDHKWITGESIAPRLRDAVGALVPSLSVPEVDMVGVTGLGVHRRSWRFGSFQRRESSDPSTGGVCSTPLSRQSQGHYSGVHSGVRAGSSARSSARSSGSHSNPHSGQSRPSLHSLAGSMGSPSRALRSSGSYASLSPELHPFEPVVIANTSLSPLDRDTPSLSSPRAQQVHFGDRQSSPEGVRRLEGRPGESRRRSATLKDRAAVQRPAGLLASGVKARSTEVLFAEMSPPPSALARSPPRSPRAGGSSRRGQPQLRKSPSRSSQVSADNSPPRAVNVGLKSSASAGLLGSPERLMHVGLRNSASAGVLNFQAASLNLGQYSLGTPLDIQARRSSAGTQENVDQMERQETSSTIAAGERRGTMQRRFSDSPALPHAQRVAPTATIQPLQAPGNESLNQASLPDLATPGLAPPAADAARQASSPIFSAGERDRSVMEQIVAPEARDRVRLLVVDDVYQQRHVMAKIIKECIQAQVGVTFEIETAEDGDEAVRAVVEAHDNEEPYTAVLMDIHMPRVSGLDAARQIRLMEQRMAWLEVPMFGVTTKFSEQQHADEMKELALQAGMQHLFFKPLTPEKVKRVLEWLNINTNKNVSGESIFEDVPKNDGYYKNMRENMQRERKDKQPTESPKNFKWWYNVDVDDEEVDMGTRKTSVDAVTRKMEMLRDHLGSLAPPPAPVHLAAAVAGGILCACIPTVTDLVNEPESPVSPRKKKKKKRDEFVTQAEDADELRQVMEQAAEAAAQLEAERRAAFLREIEEQEQKDKEAKEAAAKASKLQSPKSPRIPKSPKTPKAPKEQAPHEELDVEEMRQAMAEAAEDGAKLEAERRAALLREIEEREASEREATDASTSSKKVKKESRKKKGEKKAK